MSKEQLVFDTTDAISIEHSDKVGAVAIGVDGSGDHQLIAAISADVQRLAVDAAMKDSAGNSLTSTSGALDVNIASGVSIEVDLDHSEDSVRIGDGTTLTTVTDGIGDDLGKSGLDVNIINPKALDYLEDSVTVYQGDNPWTVDGTVNAVQSGTWVVDSITNPVTVTATDLDIRDLAFATDKVDVSGSDITATVTASDLDIRDLDHLTDSVRIGDGTNLATTTTVGSDVGLDVNILNEIAVEDSALANTAIAAAKSDLAVADTAQDVVASPLADRKYLHIMNMDNKRIYIGQSGVTAASGYPLSPKAAIMLRAGSAVDVEFVGSAGALPEIRTLELS